MPPRLLSVSQKDFLGACSVMELINGNDWKNYFSNIYDTRLACDFLVNERGDSFVSELLDAITKHKQDLQKQVKLCRSAQEGMTPSLSNRKLQAVLSSINALDVFRGDLFQARVFCVTGKIRYSYWGFAAEAYEDAGRWEAAAYSRHEQLKCAETLGEAESCLEQWKKDLIIKINSKLPGGYTHCSEKLDRLHCYLEKIGRLRNGLLLLFDDEIAQRQSSMNKPIVVLHGGIQRFFHNPYLLQCIAQRNINDTPFKYYSLFAKRPESLAQGADDSPRKKRRNRQRRKNMFRVNVSPVSLNGDRVQAVVDEPHLSPSM